jgi:hypothetical protein
MRCSRKREEEYEPQDYFQGNSPLMNAAASAEAGREKKSSTEALSRTRPWCK